MSYEYLIAGFEDIALGHTTKLSADGLLELLHEHLSAADWQLVELLNLKNDDELILALFDDDAQQDRFHETSLSEADFRTQLMYEQGMKSRNKFVGSWFEFNLNMNNVLAAAVCQKHGFDPEKAIVGTNEVATLLRKGGVQKNMSLAVALPELKEIVALTEIDNLLDREKHIDALRWQWLEEHTLFDYFNVEAVLAYYLKTTILHRWDDLTKDQGEQVFRALLADMKRDVKF